MMSDVQETSAETTTFNKGAFRFSEGDHLYTLMVLNWLLGFFTIKICPNY